MKKLKKSKKSILISGLLVATIGMGTMALSVKEDILPRFTENKLLAYNHNQDNILDNVFTQDGITILPFIYEDSEQTVSKDYILEQFDKAGIEIENISTEDIVTGTKIQTQEKTYTVLIYGDVDGDGYVDVFDAQKVMQHYVYAGENKLTGVYALAANVDNDDEEIDVFDAQRIIQFYVGYENNLVSNEPTSDLEKDKEKPVITLVGENPQKIKLGDSYVELGATVTDNIDTNIEVEIDASKVNTNEIGTYIVTYNAKDASGNEALEVQRTVIVEDYVQNIEITNPTKITYQYGEQIDLNGGNVKIQYASGKTTIIALQESMISGYDANKVGTQMITVTYEGKTATFEVKVKNYIKDIEIATLPTKTDYLEGQTIETDGMVVKVLKANGEQEEIALTDTNLKITPSTAVFGTNTIIVSYTTNNTIDDTEKTFEKTFEISVVKPVQNILIDLKTTTGYRYDSFTIAKVESGENEEAITTENLNWEIKNENDLVINRDEIAKVTAQISQFDGKVEMNFTASLAGTYTITPKVGSVNGEPIIVTVEESPIVNKMTIGDIGEKFRIGQTKTISIDFIHEYVPGNEAKIKVEANRIKVTGTGLECTLLDETGTVINVADRPNAIVKTISIKALTEGTQTLSITVDEGTSNQFIENKEITVLPEAETEVKVNNIQDITLYLKKPEGNNMVQEDNGFIYTLIPIWLEDEDGNTKKIKLADITNGNISITNSYDDPSDPLQSTQLEGYKNVGDNIEKVSNAEEEMDYIGIALLDEQAGEDLRNEEITIAYEESSVKLAIIIPKKEVENIIITEDTTTGYRYDTITIAQVKSGPNEEEITAENLTWEIRDKNNQKITDVSIAQITTEPMQFGNQMQMNFTANVAGEYTIIPKVGEVSGNPIVVTIEENPEVTKITLGEIGENYRIDQTRAINVDFIHEYVPGNEAKIEVEANRIKVTGTGLECTLLDETGTVINVVDRPNAVVKTISIKALTEGTQTLSIIVDEGTSNQFIENKEITVLPKAEAEIKVNNLQDITLYLRKPEDNDIVREEDGYIYTLIPIYLQDEDGNITNIKAGDLTNVKGESGKISIIDNLEDPLSFIQLQGYKVVDEAIQKAGSEELITYVGVALAFGGAEIDLEGGKILISRDGMEVPIELNILIQN